jgi:hypothetical protein
VLDVELPVGHAHTKFDDGGLTDDELQENLESIVSALADEARAREPAAA